MTWWKCIKVSKLRKHRRSLTCLSIGRFVCSYSFFLVSSLHFLFFTLSFTTKAKPILFKWSTPISSLPHFWKQIKLWTVSVGIKVLQCKSTRFHFKLKRNCSSVRRDQFIPVIHVQFIYVHFVLSFVSSLNRYCHCFFWFSRLPSH